MNPTENPFQSSSHESQPHPLSTQTTLPQSAPLEGTKADAPQITPEQIKAQRALGAALWVVSLVMSYFTLVRPLQAAISSAPELEIPGKMAFLTFFLFVYGATMLLFPRTATAHLGGTAERLPRFAIG